MRKKGKSYREIQQVLNCSLSTIAYHCCDKQKQQTYKRNKARNPSKIALWAKLNGFLARSKIRFSTQEVINLFNLQNGRCYLSGNIIDLNDPQSYSFDHKIPKSKGGDNSFSNLGITSLIVNQVKSTLTPKELINLCIQILKYNGYKIKCP